MHINESTILLHHSGVDLEQEDDDNGFLGVQIKCNESGLLEMKQEGLIVYVIEASGLDVGTENGKATPAEVKVVIKDKDGEDAHGAVATAVL